MKRKQFIIQILTTTLTLTTNIPQSLSQQKNKPLYSLRGHIWDVSSIAFTPDGQTLVSGSFDETIQVWNLKTRKQLRVLEGHKDGVNTVVIAPDGQTFASAGGAANNNTDKRIKLWNLKTGKLIRTLTGHSQGITSLKITPDGQTLISGSYDKTIKLWNLKTGILQSTLTGHSSWVRNIAITSDGQTLASGGGSLDTKTDTSIKLWNLGTRKLLRSLPGDDPIKFLGFTPNGTLVSGAESAIKIWNPSTGKFSAIEVTSIGGILNSAISPDGQMLVSNALDTSVKVWNLRTGTLVKTLVPPVSDEQNLDRLYPSSVTFSPDGKLLAIGHGGGAALRNFPIDIWTPSF